MDVNKNFFKQANKADKTQQAGIVQGPKKQQKAAEANNPGQQLSRINQQAPPGVQGPQAPRSYLA